MTTFIYAVIVNVVKELAIAWSEFLITYFIKDPIRRLSFAQFFS